MYVCVCAVVCFYSHILFDDDFRSVFISFIKISYQLSILIFMVRLAYVKQLAKNFISKFENFGFFSCYK